MKAIVSIIVTLAVSTACGDEDIRTKVHLQAKEVKTLIEPGRHIYGHPLGMTEDDFIKAEGAPMGYLKLTKSTAVMIYGRSHAYVFTDGKLAGLRIASHVVDWRIANAAPSDTVHSDANWEMSNGIRADMTLEDVKKILGASLIESNYETYFESGGCRVALDFATYSSGDRKGEKRICGICLSKKGA